MRLSSGLANCHACYFTLPIKTVLASARLATSTSQDDQHNNVQAPSYRILASLVILRKEQAHVFVADHVIRLASCDQARRSSGVRFWRVLSFG